MKQLLFWMIKDNWHMHWRKWRYYFREDLHVFFALFLLYFLIGACVLLGNQIKLERENMEQSAHEAVSVFFFKSPTNTTDFIGNDFKDCNLDFVHSHLSPNRDFFLFSFIERVVDSKRGDSVQIF